jgi:hypothetical protein
VNDGTSPLARLEAICATAVERAFALAFPSELEPVQVARKLVAAFESTASAGRRGGRRFIVQISPSDFARFEPERAYLVAQWKAMLARLAERAGRPQAAPDVGIAATPGVATGTVTIAVETLPEPARLALTMRKGLPRDLRRALDGPLVIGRDRACDLVLEGDPRVSRRHVTIEVTGGVSFRDLGSANGTFLNGSKRNEGELHVGDVVRIGDSELAVVADET